MNKNWKKLLQNILLFPFALLLIVVAIEGVVFLGGFVLLGIIKLDDITKLFSSPVFHGLALLAALLMFVPWKKVAEKYVYPK